MELEIRLSSGQQKPELGLGLSLAKTTQLHWKRCFDTLTFILVWTQPVDACIEANNNKLSTALSIEACKELCQDEESFPCVSIDYNTNSNKCQMSILNSVSASSAYKNPCSSTGWLYAEKAQFPGKRISFGCDTIFYCKGLILLQVLAFPASPVRR